MRALTGAGARWPTSRRWEHCPGSNWPRSQHACRDCDRGGAGIRHPTGSRAVEESAARRRTRLQIAVRTPEHDAIVHAAAQAGKHVFCEWPPSPTCEQAESAYRAVAEAGVCHMVGLQGYQSPGARYVRRLVDAGAIGKLVSLSLVARGGPSGSVRIPAANVYAAS